MKLGLMLGYSGAEMTLPVEAVQRAEALGFDAVWTAEAYGSDAITSPSAYLAAHTERIRLGTAVIQLAGRTPAMAAMQIAHPGRSSRRRESRRLRGIGVSGPADRRGLVRSSPGASPYWRIRDYVSDHAARCFAREAPVEPRGHARSRLPYTGEGRDRASASR